MECSDPQIVHWHTQQGFDAAAHFRCGFIREGHSKNAQW